MGNRTKRRIIWNILLGIHFMLYQIYLGEEKYLFLSDISIICPFSFCQNSSGITSAELTLYRLFSQKGNVLEVDLGKNSFFHHVFGDWTCQYLYAQGE